MSLSLTAEPKTVKEVANNVASPTLKGDDMDARAQALMNRSKASLALFIFQKLAATAGYE